MLVDDVSDVYRMNTTVFYDWGCLFPRLDRLYFPWLPERILMPKDGIDVAQWTQLNSVDLDSTENHIANAPRFTSALHLQHQADSPIEVGHVLGMNMGTCAPIALRSRATPALHDRPPHDPALEQGRR